MGALTAILILSLGILACVRMTANTGNEPVAVRKCVLYASRRDGAEGISLYTELPGASGLWINGWEKDGQQWLFLPAILKGRQAIFQNEMLILQEGEHIFEKDNGESVEVRILFGSEIPFANLETESGSLQFLRESKKNREKGSLCFVGADQTLEYADGLKKVKIRGNATRLQPKSPFRIKLESAASLAGLGKSEDYVLLAEYGDISLMQNKAAFELAKRTTDLYEPGAAHIDLYVNGDYMGVYLLCEGISIGENRLEIADLEYETELLYGEGLDNCDTFAHLDGEDTIAKGYELPRLPEDITGGYLLELEYHGRYEGEETTGFRTAEDWSLVIKEPEHASREQVSYIKEKFQQAENAMYADDWTDPETGKTLEELVDMKSFVHKYLIDEICMNTDLWTSQFLYKDKGDDQFHFGPVWDYDMAFGHYDTGFSPEEFYGNWHIWYGEVYENPVFYEMLKEEYRNVYLPVLEELTEAKLEEWKDQISDSARMNFLRWDIDEIYGRNSITYTGDTFEACVDSLRDYLEKRTEFLSSEWL